MNATALSTTGSSGVRLLDHDRTVPALAGLRGSSMCVYAIDALHTAARGCQVRVEIDLLRDCVTVLPGPVPSRPGWRLVSIRPLTRLLHLGCLLRARQPAGQPDMQVTGLPQDSADSSVQNLPRPARPAPSMDGASFDAVIAGLAPWPASRLVRPAIPHPRR